VSAHCFVFFGGGGVSENKVGINEFPVYWIMRKCWGGGRREAE
jgi:hypothetical protein